MPARLAERCGSGSRGRQMRDFSYQIRLVGGIGIAVVVAGCGLVGPGLQAVGQAGAPTEKITQDAAPSAFLAVTIGPASGPALSGLVASTARPDEDLTILQAGSPARIVVASDSPAPAEKVIPGPPATPRGSQTSYQSAQYIKKLKDWRAMREAGVRTIAAEIRSQTSSWASRLQLSQRISRLAGHGGNDGSLTAESAVAANAMAGLQQEAGNVFGSRRVIVLLPADLSAALPAGELTGDDVIVVTSYLLTAAAASAAQAELLGAGAAQAAVVGPEVTAAQLRALVSADLSQTGMTDSVSTPVLFGNGNAVVDTFAASRLTRLLARLREPGMTAVINGYASVSGTPQANYALSYERAANVARFFEAHGIPATSLIIVGHGATDSFGSGQAAANRRVLVVSERPASAS
jgi:outer membrane protein OmpA-like peptidoglycan-associated protein